MTDRELLELAAKAAGYDTSHQLNAERLAMSPYVDALYIAGVSTAWNPLIDDGDALRLAVKLHLINDWQSLIERYIDEDVFNFDNYAATRRAIVRAAAEIGKQANPGIERLGGRKGTDSEQ